MIICRRQAVICTDFNVRYRVSLDEQTKTGQTAVSQTKKLSPTVFMNSSTEQRDHISVASSARRFVLPSIAARDFSSAQIHKDIDRCLGQQPAQGRCTRSVLLRERITLSGFCAVRQYTGQGKTNELAGVVGKLVIQTREVPRCADCRRYSTTAASPAGSTAQSALDSCKTDCNLGVACPSCGVRSHAHRTQELGVAVSTFRPWPHHVPRYKPGSST